MPPWIPLIYKTNVTIVCPGFTGSSSLSSFPLSTSSTLALLLLHRSLDALCSSALLYIVGLCLSLLSVQIVAAIYCIVSMYQALCQVPCSYICPHTHTHTYRCLTMTLLFIQALFYGRGNLALKKLRNLP